jgi:myosin heavy subunit
MNKKQISVMVSLAIILVSGAPLFAADKKDVADPVLKEVINELSPKMPRFIDKYGPSIFVSDEQVTRAALLLALYEYDKRNSAASLAANFASKKDFDLLSTRLSVIEKSGASGKSSAAAGSSVDMIKLMNDLDPNMPMLLDNNLANSKVFKDLQKKVDMMGLSASSSGKSVPNIALTNMKTDIDNLNKRIETFEMASKQQTVSARDSGKSSKELDELKLSFAQIQKSYVNIAKRIDELENRPVMTASSKDGKVSDAQIEALNAKINSIKNTVSDIPTNNYVKSEINKTSANVKRLEQKINELESSGVSSGAGESKSSTGTFAKISLGLTMVAALFVAR